MASRSPSQEVITQTCHLFFSMMNDGIFNRGLPMYVPVLDFFFWEIMSITGELSRDSKTDLVHVGKCP
jgi:hypothetical protein